MKKISKENLIIRDSFQLSFSSSEIWCEELDALNLYTDVVIEKFLKDMITIRRPSSPGLIVIHLNETLVGKDLVNVIITELTKAEHSINKVAFVGLNHTAKKLMEFALGKASVSFSYGFHSDYEKAKEWLVPKKR
ncbi:MAG TPA: hypothetical protein VIK72_01225 [Clostridiaceae bacterium]